VIDMAGAAPPRRRRGRLLILGGAAVGMAAAITAVIALGGLEPVGVQTPTASAEQVLQHAVNAARTEPWVTPRADQFLYVRTEYPNAKPALRVHEAWMSIDGTHDGLIKSAGSQDPIPGCRNGQAAVYKGPDPLPGVTEPCTPQPAYKADAPTTKQGMLDYIDQNLKGEPGDTNALAKNIRDLVRNALLPPESLAAVLEAAADINGLEVVQNAEDGTGRHDIGWPTTTTGEHYTMVFGKDTYAFLGLTGFDSTTHKLVDTAGATS
jgi:hypothetical protein